MEQSQPQAQPTKSKRYKTVSHHGKGEYEEKKSIFLASVCPVSSESEALEFLASIRAEHATATHNVYAYHVIDENNTTIQRYSDDGEPSGTSGIPVLDAFRKKGLQNMIVVVTRYFGGTLLGASGLVRCYGKCASLGIIDAGIVERTLSDEVVITCEYSMLGKLKNHFEDFKIPVLSINYLQDVEITVAIPVEDTESFVAEMVDMTNDTVLIEIGESRYFDIDENGVIVL